MDESVLLDQLLEAIAQAKPKTGDGRPFELIPTKENGLAKVPKVKILAILDNLASNNTPLELCLPPLIAEGGRRGHYLFDTEKGRIFSRHLYPDGWPGFPPQVETNSIPDEKVPIRLKLLKDFDNWLTAYRLQRRDDLQSLIPINLGKIYCTVLDIDEKLQVNPSSTLQIKREFRNHSPFMGYSYSSYEYRNDALNYLKNKGVVRAFNVGDYFVDVVIDIPRFQDFKARVIQIHQTKVKELLPPDSPPEAPSEAKKPTQEDSDIIYAVKYLATREILVNDLQITRPDFEGENEIIFRYLFENPNRTVKLDELQKKLGGEPVKKDLHKIVENLGFKGDLKDAFFSVSKDSILFRNPIRREDMKKLAKDWLRIPRS